MIHKILLSTMLISLIFGSNYSYGENEDLVATIGTEKLSHREFNRRYAEVQKQTLNPPSKAVFLNDLVRYKMGLQEAKKRGIDKDPLVQERMEQEVYKGLIEKDLAEQIEKIKITETELKDFYQKNPEIRTSHILIETKPNGGNAEIAEREKHAEEVYKDVKTSKRPFEDLAKIHSDDSMTKDNGGDVGWQTRLSLVPEYYNASLKLKDGQVHGLVKTRFGFHIIKLTGRKTYENANKRQLRAAVFDEKRSDLFNKYFDKLKSKYTIKIFAKDLQ